jgi:preprotein translocase subunit SecE
MARTSPTEFIHQVRQELGRVTWPTRKETLVTTGMVFLMVFVAAAFFFAVARYKDTHEPTDLRGIKGWKRLQSQYPLSPWRIKQSWTEAE